MLSKPMRIEESQIFCKTCAKTTKHVSVFGGEFICADCSERTGLSANQNKKEQAYQNLKGLLLDSTGVHEEHLSLPLDQNEEVVAGLKNYCRDLSKSIKEGKNLLLYGDVGTGKTTSAIKIALQAFKKGLSVKYAKGYEDVARGDLEQCSLLILDELHMAVRLFGEKPSDDDLIALYQLVESRRNAKKATIFITNFGKTGLPALLGDSIYDRITAVDRTTRLFFRGDSYRNREVVSNDQI